MQTIGTLQHNQTSGGSANKRIRTDLSHIAFGAMTETEWRAFFQEHFPSAGLSVLRDTLNEYGARIGLDSSSRVLTNSSHIAKSLIQWRKEDNLDPPASIIVASETGSSEIPGDVQQTTKASRFADVPDESCTHALFDLSGQTNRKDVVQSIQQILFPLRWKGIAIITHIRKNRATQLMQTALESTSAGESLEEYASFAPENLDDWVDLLMGGKIGFERGKTRFLSRSFVLREKDLDSLVAELEREVAKSVGDSQEMKEWRAWLDNALSLETKEQGGLLVELSVIVAMKWDVVGY